MFQQLLRLPKAGKEFENYLIQETQVTQSGNRTHRRHTQAEIGCDSNVSEHMVSRLACLKAIKNISMVSVHMDNCARNVFIE